MEKNKVKIYIDGANMFYTQKRLGWSVDWKKVKDFIEREKNVIEWRYYVGVKENDEKMLKYLVKKLKDSGLKVSVFSSRKTISWELKLECSRVFYFESLKDKIMRE